MHASNAPEDTIEREGEKEKKRNVVLTTSNNTGNEYVITNPSSFTTEVCLLARKIYAIELEMLYARLNIDFHKSGVFPRIQILVPNEFAQIFNHNSL